MFEKKNLILGLLAISCTLIAQALEPEVDYSSGYISIDNVERTPEGTRVDVTLNHLPHYWVKVDSTVVLTDASTGQTFRITGQENLPLSTEIWMPESGHHQGTVIFERIPEDVKVVDMVNSADPEDEFAYGIHLDMPRIPIIPSGLSREDILARAPHPEKWDGLSPSKYRDMDFLRPGATALVRGHIDHYTPKAGYSTVSVITENEITNKDNKTVGDIDSLGSFSLPVPVDYPQMVYLRMGDMLSGIFLTPGDTLDIHTTTRVVRREPYWHYYPEYFNLSGSNQDAVDISLLRRDIESELVSGEYDWRRISQLEENGLDSVMVAVADIKSKMSQFVRTAPGKIDRYHVSPYAKDILYTYAIVNNYLPLEELAMHWRDRSMMMEGSESDRKWVPNPEYKEIDGEAYYGGQDDYAQLVYDNPLVLIDSGPFINRCEFNSLFRPISFMTLVADPADAEDCKSLRGNIKAYADTTLAKFGLDGCFIEQLVVAKGLCRKISNSTATAPSGLVEIPTSVTVLMPMIDNRTLVSSVLDKWGAVCREVGRREADSSSGALRSVDSQSAVLAEVIRPYLGNVVYVDVWSYGCGPCRAGILDQREVISHYEGQPLKVIYLADEREKEQCERWMSQNDIKGEHLYLPHDNMERFNGDFNIVGIPFGILIDKKGNVISTKLHSISKEDPKIESLLKE